MLLPQRPRPPSWSLFGFIEMLGLTLGDVWIGSQLGCLAHVFGLQLIYQDQLPSIYPS